MILPPFLQRWIFLNIVRLLTIVSCTLVIASTIRTLRINFQHYPPPLLPPSIASTTSYYPSTDIPTTFFGVFWSTLRHVSLSLVLFTVILSELSLPIPLLHRLFKNTLPFLGPNWGTGFPGVLLVLVAADGLSRGDAGGKFAEVSNWALAGVGVGNVCVGLVWRAKAKVVRSPMGWKRDVAEKMECLAEAKRKAERVVDGLTLPAVVKEKEEHGGGGLKDLFGTARKAVWNKEKRQAKKDLEKAETPAMSIFTPSLPSAIVSSRVPPPLQATAAAPTASADKSPPQAATIPPLIVPCPPSASPQIGARHSNSTCSTSTASVYSLDLPPSQPTLFNSPTLTPASPSLAHSPPRKAPTLKTVRFQPTIHHPSTTIDSLRAPISSTTIAGSKFLILPSPTTDGERSPSVLASLKAAMLEAQAKANAHQNKKSLYLGSDRWQAEYHNLASSNGDKPKDDDKPKVDTHRPYDFL